MCFSSFDEFIELEEEEVSEDLPASEDEVFSDDWLVEVFGLEDWPPELGVLEEVAEDPPQEASISKEGIKGDKNFMALFIKTTSI